jgi:heme/copper-type cytochrome/quinol oxidase subunit 2
VSAPAFAKNPKFIIGAIVVLWLAYVIYSNIHLSPVQISLFPYLLTLQINVSALIVASAIFGCVATLIVQWLWRRRRSKNGSVSAAAPAANSSTVA